MNLMTFFVSLFIIFINKIYTQDKPRRYICDFFFNEISSVKPIISDKNDNSPEYGCTINAPYPDSIIVLLCPIKKGPDFSDIELIPSSCFASHLYSPYTAGKNEKSIEKLKIPIKYTYSIPYNDYEAKFFYLPANYKYKDNIYCRCDNRKTESQIDNKKKLMGKIGLVKISMNEKFKNPKTLDIVKDNNFKLEENRVYSIELDVDDFNQSDDCGKIAIIVMIKNNDGYALIMTSPLFFASVTCNVEFKGKSGNHIVTVIINETKDLEGCDFTKPKGEGKFKRGFDLNSISGTEKKCTVYVKTGKRKSIASIKCPYNLTPIGCFKHVLYEKEIDNKKEFKPFILDDIIGSENNFYLFNEKEKIFSVMFPDKAERYAAVRCICESQGKKGIMELKIASSYNFYISLFLLLIAIIALYL